MLRTEHPNVVGRFVPYLAYAYISLAGLSSRIRWEGLEHVRAAESSGGFIYAFWHQRQMLFTYTHRGPRAPTVLVSRSRDGELIARTMELSRIPALRGSSSRGGASAARGLLEILAAGGRVAVTPDGPRGPSRQVKPGALFLARKSGRPIVPIANAVSRRLEIRGSWDRFQVPLPFARVFVCHGPPIYVGPEDGLERKAEELRRALDGLTEQADRLAGA